MTIIQVGRQQGKSKHLNLSNRFPSICSRPALSLLWPCLSPHPDHPHPPVPSLPVYLSPFHVRICVFSAFLLLLPFVPPLCPSLTFILALSPFSPFLPMFFLPSQPEISLIQNPSIFGFHFVNYSSTIIISGQRTFSVITRISDTS